MPDNALTAFHEWLKGLAWQIHALIRDPVVLERFREMILQWYLDVRLRNSEIAEWECRRDEHIGAILATPRLRNESAGPPQPDWAWWETVRPVHVERDDGWHHRFVNIAGWAPPEVVNAEPEDYWPLPLSQRPLRIEEKYTLLSAIRDRYCEGVEKIDPWHQPVGAGESVRQATDGIRYGVLYGDRLLKLVKPEDRPAIEAFLAEVEDDLRTSGACKEGPVQDGLTSKPEPDPAVLATQPLGTARKPRIRLFELLIKLRVDQLERESAWKKAVQRRAEVIAKASRKNLTDAQRNLIAEVDAGHIPAVRQEAPDGRWIDGLQEIDSQAYTFFLHRGNPESPACRALAENELKDEGTPEWRRLKGDRFLDGKVWRFRTTPWRFVVGKLQSEKAMPFSEVELFEAVRLVQLQQPEQVSLAIRQFIADQDDCGYTDDLLAALRNEYNLDGTATNMERNHLVGVEHASSKRPPAPIELDDNAWLTHKDIADRLGLDREMVRKRLDRFRARNHDCYREVTDRKPREPRYLYHVRAIRPALDARTASGQTSGERPAK